MPGVVSERELVEDLRRDLKDFKSTLLSSIHPGVNAPLNREAGFGPASNRLAETFSLNRLLSSPQQPSAVAMHSTNNFKMVNPRKLASVASGAGPYRDNVRNVID